MKIGSLFSGCGGLDLAVLEEFPGSTLAWHCENDEAPSAILAHHWPDVPNLGDIQKVNWEEVEKVDIVVGSSPCQDLSAAGRKAGMSEGTRSNLWVNMREAVEILKPKYVFWENVKGVRSAKAKSESDLEQGDGQVGNLRALGRVLGDLTEIGYDVQWETVRAADVLAPHGRERVFVLATYTHE